VRSSDPTIADPTSSKIAVLVAQGEVKGIDDQVGLLDVLGSELSTDFEVLEANLMYGQQKEPPHILTVAFASIFKEHEDFGDCTLQECGFVAARSSISHPCVYRSSALPVYCCSARSPLLARGHRHLHRGAQRDGPAKAVPLRSYA
jgi:hypothetical protein